jgi:hypothetical protein
MTWGMNSGGCVEASGMGDGRGEIGDYCYDMMGMMDMMDDCDGFRCKGRGGGGFVFWGW